MGGTLAGDGRDCSIGTLGSGGVDGGGMAVRGGGLPLLGPHVGPGAWGDGVAAAYRPAVGCPTGARGTDPGPGAIARGARGITGTYFRKNFLFRRVIRPEPSTRTTYWSNWRTSTTIPVLSHLVGWGPVWFWMRTQSPTTKGGSMRVCSVKRSEVRIWRLRKASTHVAGGNRAMCRGAGISLGERG